MFDVRAFPRVGPLTQRLEQGPVIQERGFALISPRCVALLTPGVQPFTLSAIVFQFFMMLSAV